MVRKIVHLFLVSILFSASASWGKTSEAISGQNQSETIQRFALVVGKDDGGLGRSKLRYAVSDAKAFSHVLEELGGLDPHDRVLLTNPDQPKLIEGFNRLKSMIRSSNSKDARKELFIYYSGHSNEKGLLLGNDVISYTQLKTLIQNAKADLNVVILDSCASGVLTRLKGGEKRPPFLRDTLSKLKGNVVLTSASASESAQESERIQGSFFTHFLISGLRGAADTSGSKKVTLNDAYQYSYHQTLAHTEHSISGPQHPSYSIELSGNGELVMTDLRKASALLVAPQGWSGKLYIRDQLNRMVAELAFNKQKSTQIAVEPGHYSLVWVKRRKNYFFAPVDLKAHQTVEIKVSQFEKLDPEETVARGYVLDEDDRNLSENSLVSVPVEFGIIPELSTNVFDSSQTKTHFSFSLIYGRTAQLSGFSLAGGGMFVDQKMEGVQIAGLWNHVYSDSSGVQMTLGWNRTQNRHHGVQVGGLFNQTKSLSGGQIGAINVASEEAFGGQVGAFNFADKMSYGLQIGAGNWIQNGSFMGAQIGGINWNQQHEGLQIGAINRAVQLSGIQIGAINYSEQASGAQFGLVNYSDKIGGTQIGLLNINTDPEDESLPIGLVNISKSSRWSAAFSYTDLAFNQGSLKYGHPRSYGFLEFGWRTFEGSWLFMKNIGIGFSALHSNRFNLNIEALYSRLDTGTIFKSNGDNLFQARLIPKLYLIKNLAVFAGLNFYHILDYSSYERSPLLNRTTWLGYLAGIEVVF